MQYTSNLNLKKPGLSDNIAIADFNYNFDAIDTAINNLAGGGTEYTAGTGIGITSNVIRSTYGEQYTIPATNAIVFTESDMSLTVESNAPSFLNNHTGYKLCSDIVYVNPTTQQMKTATLKATIGGVETSFGESTVVDASSMLGSGAYIIVFNSATPVPQGMTNGFTATDDTKPVIAFLNLGANAGNYCGFFTTSSTALSSANITKLDLYQMTDAVTTYRTLPLTAFPFEIKTFTVQINVADWNSGTTCTKAVSGLKPWFSVCEFSKPNIRRNAISENTISLIADQTPTESVTVYIMQFNS